MHQVNRLCCHLTSYGLCPWRHPWKARGGRSGRSRYLLPRSLPARVLWADRFSHRHLQLLLGSFSKQLPSVSSSTGGPLFPAPGSCTILRGFLQLCPHFVGMSSVGLRPDHPESLGGSLSHQDLNDTHMKRLDTYEAQPMLMTFTDSVIMVSFMMRFRRPCFLFRKGNILQKHDSASISTII